MKVQRRSRFFLVILALLLAFPALAEEEEEKELTVEEQLIRDNKTLSKMFDHWAEGIDLFLAGRRLTKQKNETNVRIENSTYWKDYEGTENTTNLAVNLRLPNVEKYWNLKFTTYDEQEEARGVRQNYLRQRPRERNYGATVGLFRKLGNVKTSFQPRIQLGNPLKVAHSLKFESLADLKKYTVNPKYEFFADPDKGTGMYMQLDFNILLTKVYSVTFINEGEYKDKLHLYTVSNGVSLTELITPRSSFSYSLVFTSLNQPSYHLEAYSLSVSWNQTLYKNILDYQVIPHLDFEKNESFTGRTGLTFNFNINF